MARKNSLGIDNVVTYQKNCQAIDPSVVLLIKDTVYSFRSIIAHMGSSIEEEDGHIIAILNTVNGWITCNDNPVSTPSLSVPSIAQQGYKYIYDRVEDSSTTIIQESIPSEPTSSIQQQTHSGQPSQTVIPEISKHLTDVEDTKRCRACTKDVGEGILYHIRFHPECSIGWIRKIARKITNKNEGWNCWKNEKVLQRK